MTWWRSCKHRRDAAGCACRKCGARWTVDQLGQRWTAPLAHPQPDNKHG